MMSIFERYLVKKRLAVTEKEAFLATPWSQMMSPFKIGLKVFREPQKCLSVDDYEGPPEYFTLFKVKLFKKPVWLINHGWVVKPARYGFRLTQLYLTSLPSAKCVVYGKEYTLQTSITKTNFTSALNYWTSLIEYQEGMGAHRGSLSKTVIKLGKESMGVQFGDYNPHQVTLYDDDYMEKPAFGNSMYFVVDRSYIKPEFYKDYDFGAKQYEREESPLLI